MTIGLEDIKGVTVSSIPKPFVLKYLNFNES